MKSSRSRQTEIPRTDPEPTAGDGAATVATGEAPVRLAQVAQDRAQLHELDRRALLALLLELHVVEAAALDRLLALDAQDTGDDELWTVEQPAVYLKLQPDWLRRRHDLPFVLHVGGAIRISKRRLDTWLKRHAGAR